MFDNSGIVVFAENIEMGTFNIKRASLVFLLAFAFSVNADLILPVLADEILPVYRPDSVEANGSDA